MTHSRESILNALKTNEFIPYYQPVIHSGNGKVAGCEILARWHSQSDGIVEAGKFIASVTEHGFLQEMTKMLMKKTHFDFSQQRNSQCDFFTTINVDLHLLMSAEFRNKLICFCHKLRNEGVRLIAEITEHENVNEYKMARRELKKLAKAGVDFAVDDFGTGYANEDLLQVSQAKIIKIDKKYAQNPECEVSDFFLQETVRLAKNYHAQVVIEGIENHEQERKAKMSGVDYLQGFLYSRPLPFEHFNHALSFY